MTPRGAEYLVDSLKMKYSKNLQTKQYNKGARQLQTLEEGDTVRLQPFKLGCKEWERGVVTKRLDERSYEVETSLGTLRRNRVHLTKTAESTPTSESKPSEHPAKPTTDKAQEAEQIPITSYNSNP